MSRLLKRGLLVFVCSATVIATAVAAVAAGDQFFTLASVQTATLDRGEMVLKLTANGPIACKVIEADDAPALHIRLYGVDASAVGAGTTTEVGTLRLTPDGAGNLDVTLQPAGAFAGRALRVTAGRTANEIEVRLAPDAHP